MGRGGTAALFLRGAKVDRVEALSGVCFPASAVSGTGTLVPKPDAASHHHTNTAAGTTTATVSHTQHCILLSGYFLTVTVEDCTRH